MPSFPTTPSGRVRCLFGGVINPVADLGDRQRISPESDIPLPMPSFSRYAKLLKIWNLGADPPCLMKGMSFFIISSLGAMPFPLSETIRGGVGDNLEELILKRLSVN
ncbi:hypothetical protein Tco_0746290 [Tanacetum coccineum]